MANLPGTLVVLSGPAGVGKTTVAARLLESPDFVRSTSATTRAPRAGEVDGRDYRFLTMERYRELLAESEFIEHAEVFDNGYGTPKEPLRQALRARKVMLLVIDIEGGRQVREQNLDALLVFLAPPGRQELERRLAGRGTEDETARTKRLSRAAMEEEFARKYYDHVAVNDDLDACVKQVAEWIDRHRRSLAEREAKGETLYGGLMA